MEWVLLAAAGVVLSRAPRPWMLGVIGAVLAMMVAGMIVAP